MKNIKITEKTTLYVSLGVAISILLSVIYGTVSVTSNYLMISNEIDKLDTKTTQANDLRIMEMKHIELIVKDKIETINDKIKRIEDFIYKTNVSNDRLEELKLTLQELEQDYNTRI